MHTTSVLSSKCEFTTAGITMESASRFFSINYQVLFRTRKVDQYNHVGGHLAARVCSHSTVPRFLHFHSEFIPFTASLYTVSFSRRNSRTSTRVLRYRNGHPE